MSERDTKSICTQLLLTADFFQRNKIIHRDFKLGNVLLWSNTENMYDIRVADLGFAIEEKDKGFAIANGTPGFIAAEILF